LGQCQPKREFHGFLTQSNLDVTQTVRQLVTAVTWFRMLAGYSLGMRTGTRNFFSPTQSPFHPHPRLIHTMKKQTHFPIYRMASQPVTQDMASQAADGLFWQALQRFGQWALMGVATLATLAVLLSQFV
jgi:hypothetical protein